MPSAPSHLQDKFPEGDSQALDLLSLNFNIGKDGVIRPKVEGYKATKEEDDAIDYLWLEWDYGYSNLR